VGPVNVVGFADDTLVRFSFKNINHLVETMEHKASRVLDYMSRNKLVANAEWLPNNMSQRLQMNDKAFQ
jgi:hypothetical protein